jgi:NAD(P)-dependent dehydrogenase (short-subunit alcohol dehydrogenase family)
MPTNKLTNQLTNQLGGKIALITGGARGLGREMALAFAEAGATGVAITAAPGSDETSDAIQTELNDTLGEIGARGCMGLALLGDVAVAEDCQRVVAETIEAFGALHILVNNAGKAGRYAHGGKGSMPIHEADPEGFRAVIDTNVLGPYLMAWAAARHLEEAGWGRIINISKRTQSMHRKAITPYGPSKAAMEAATIAWAEAMFGTGITVNSLSPGGAINTKFGSGEITGHGPEPSVIRNMAVWLASPASDGVSGCRYCADKWDETLPPDAAAERCRERAIFPLPSYDTPLDKAWVEPTG